MSDLLGFLRDLLEEAAAPLPGVTHKRMFGCDALFAEGNIFALIWKTGRIGVRLPDTAAFAKLLDLDGAEPWQVGEKTMGHWLLVPEDFHDEPESLGVWVRQAHAYALANGPKASKGHGDRR